MANELFGLSENARIALRNEIARIEEIENVRIFGSRAMGNYKPGSDVDIAIYGERVDSRVADMLSRRLNEESLLPYYFDVLAYGDISNTALKEHIDTFGLPFDLHHEERA